MLRELLKRWGLFFLIWHVLVSVGVMVGRDGEAPSSVSGYGLALLLAIIVTVLRVRYGAGARARG